MQLCRYHHRLVHEHAFGCERTSSGEIRFTNLIGKEIGRTGVLPKIPADGDARDWLREELDELAIDSRTIVPRMHAGQKMDWDLAVGHLFTNRWRSPAV